MAAMYAVYHGSDGLQRIAQKVHKFTQVFKSAVEAMGYESVHDSFFDTVTLDVSAVTSAEAVHKHACRASINLRRIDDKHVGVTFDESVSANDLVKLLEIFSSAASANTLSLADLAEPTTSSIPANLRRTSEFLQHPVFNKHHSETEMLRYITHLASKDLGLVHSMIPLGSCTMKLNSTSSMIPLTWPEFSSVHPFAPPDQVKGYHHIIKVYLFLYHLASNHHLKELEDDLCKITGFAAASLQPNSGAAGEYTGLCVIRAYHESRGEGRRNICLIPFSAHGTNPAVSVNTFISLSARLSSFHESPSRLPWLA